MKRIKYFCFYHCSQPNNRRDNSPAADTKIDYIVEVLNRLGYGVDIISLAPLSERKFYKRGTVISNGQNTFRYFASFGHLNNRIIRKLNKYWMLFQLLIWSLRNIVKQEKILVYHSSYEMIFMFLKKVKKIFLIGEIEEIYQNYLDYSKYASWKEYKFFSVCDKFIFPNTILNEYINETTKKEYIVIHGVYRYSAKRSTMSDGKIHVLYSGTFNAKKGGALVAIKMAEFLTDNYIVHICGFGNENETLNIREAVAKSSCSNRIVFHGFLSPEGFESVIQSCHIGLCTQDPSTPLNLTSFPSKILYYMSYGLAVVTGHNRAIDESKVVNNLVFYNNQDSYSIANAVQSIAINTNNNRDLIAQLDAEFEQDLKCIIG